MRPTIGQTVYYSSLSTTNQTEHIAAIVTKIGDGGQVSLFVMYPTRQEFVQEVEWSAQRERGCWSYRP